MLTRILTLLETLHSSYWFLPAVMSGAAIALSILAIQVDRSFKPEVVESLGWVYSGGAQGSRSVLSSIAGSMITVTGVVFSITIVAFSLASSQFGPRLLRNFMRDTGNQVVLGTFIATFVYCLLVMRTIRESDQQGGFVPHFAVTIGIVLALASVGVLIYFIHHVTESIQVNHLMSVVASDLQKGVREQFPERDDGEADPEVEEVVRRLKTEDSGSIEAGESGYIQTIDEGRLIEVASENDLFLELRFRPGQYVIAGDRLSEVHGSSRIGDEVRQQLRQAFILGHVRTQTQDVSFLTDQLVEIALRALSPSINDPFTAMSCLDWLAPSLVRIGQNAPQPPYGFDGDGHLRLASQRLSFSEVIELTLDRIRQYSGDHAVVLQHLGSLLGRLRTLIRSGEHRKTLDRQAEKVRRDLELASAGLSS